MISIMAELSNGEISRLIFWSGHLIFISCNFLSLRVVKNLFYFRVKGLYMYFKSSKLAIIKKCRLMMQHLFFFFLFLTAVLSVGDQLLLVLCGHFRQ